MTSGETNRRVWVLRAELCAAVTFAAISERVNERRSDNFKLNERSAHGDWQKNSERTTGPAVACELDLPAIGLNRPASDRQAQPYTPFFPRTAGIDAIKPVENTMAMRRRNTRSCVAYLDSGLAGTRPTYFDSYCAAIGSVLYRVMYEVH